MTVPPETDADTAAEPDADPPSGWRDLSRTKWRLTKGDEQLDFTFSRSDPPHHIPDDPVSELAVCMYKVRTSSEPARPGLFAAFRCSPARSTPAGPRCSLHAAGAAGT